MEQLFFVGSYTHSSLEGKGQGIYTCSLEPSTGKLRHLETFPLTNPSYLVLDNNHEYAFAVEESFKDLSPSVHSFSVTEGGGLKPLSKQLLPGEIACHLELDATGRFLAVANYGTGDVIFYGVKDGLITGQLDAVQHHGKSVNEQRQEGPHAHATVFSPDNQFLFVADLGLDEVKTYTFDTGKLEPYSTFKTKPGAGPRHLEFHPNARHAFILNELDASLLLVRYQAGVFVEVQTVSTLPDDYARDKWAAAIHVSPNGKNVYASNRVHDSIAVFAFDEDKESLTQLQVVSSGGEIPRDFTLDRAGKLLITAHQNSHDLYSFWIDETGRLEPTGHRLELGSPVCVKML
jgi:6-phosphogluconolactonase